MNSRHKPISRRESLRRITLLAGASGLPFSFAAASGTSNTPWVTPPIPLVSSPGYGTDPDLIHPSVPWPKTLSPKQLELASVLADILIPAEGRSPSASAVGVPDVLDEWISAPYPEQQKHRVMILTGLLWCDGEAQRRFGRPFVQLDNSSQVSIVDDIAYPEILEPAGFSAAREFFSLLRALVTGMYYTSPQGVSELGYQGNVPVSGEYPGPSPAAIQHLQKVIKELGLT